MCSGDDYQTIGFWCTGEQMKVAYDIIYHNLEKELKKSWQNQDSTKTHLPKNTTNEQ